LNDANPHLINFYNWVRAGLTITIDARNQEPVYYANRARFNQHIQAKTAGSNEAAQLFYYLNRTGFNGLCRFNLSGEFNVPFGRYSDRLKYVADFTSYRQQFKQWTFTCSDFEDLAIEAEDFIYADPPYDVDFTTYSRGGFSWADQVRTANWLAAHQGPVLLSNQATPRIEELYTRLGFRLEYHEAPRRIRCNGDRTFACEVLAIKGL
jgi:DNA adenine methylase